MKGLYVTNGREVYPDPTVPDDGGAVLAAGMIVPQDKRLAVNGAPVMEDSHTLVISPLERTGSAK